jgi:uncharacterized protein YbgA (DUF1722 family)
LIGLRVWDIHPGYLSRQSLLGQHVEIHALAAVICGGKKGYAAHPETRRWVGHGDKLARRHDLTVSEMSLRGFNHASPCPVSPESSPARLSFVDFPVLQIQMLGEKYRQRAQAGRIPLPKRESQFWAQHKYSVMARGYNYYREIQGFMKGRPDNQIAAAEDLVMSILELMELPVTVPALMNTLDHLWGYFKREANAEEKKSYLNSEPGRPALDDLYRLAVKYNRQYLLHSTVFADLPPGGISSEPA